MSKESIIALSLIFICQVFPKCEDIYPEAGKICPDFVLKNIKYFEKRQAGLHDFKGKWLVLDFWNKTCSSCISSFPKISELQKEMGDKVQFMLVGIQDQENQIELMYDKFKEKEKLVMPCAFDSSLANRWDIFTAPYIIVIDPNGKVQAITYSVNAENLLNLMKGAPHHLPKAYRVHEEMKDTMIAYDEKRPLLINGNGGVDSEFLFRSLLSAFNSAKQHVYVISSIYNEERPGTFQVLGATIANLYMYAYVGTVTPDSDFYPNPIVEIKDTLLFRAYKEFCYSLHIPPYISTKQRMMDVMQRDLTNYFPYTAKIEERKFPCFKLVVLTSDAKRTLASKGGRASFKVVVPKVEFIATNYDFGSFLALLGRFNGNDIINATDITGNIDIHFNGFLASIVEVKAELNKHGLDLIPAERPLKVLVIREKS